MANTMVESFKDTQQQEKQPQYDSKSSKREEYDHNGYHRRGGFCSRTGIYSSLFQLGPHHVIPSEEHVDVASFVLSQLPPRHISETKIAFVDSATGDSLTYSQLRHSALSLAASLHHGLGLCKGDVVLLLSPNSILYPAICLAILASGAIVTPANPLNTAAEVTRQVRHSGAKLAICAPEEAHKLDAIGIPTILTTTTNTSTSLLSVEELMEGGDPFEAPSMEIKQSDVAALLYSSGTSGMSKGVVLTQGNLISISMIIKWGVEASQSEEDVFLGFLPMSHVYGLAFFALGLPCVGSTTVVMSRFSYQGMMEAVDKYQINNILVVPPVVLAMSSDREQRWDLSSLRRVGTGGAPLGAQAGEEFRRRFPWVVLREGYGLTETCGPAMVFASEAEARDRKGSAGQLLPLLEGKVVEVSSGKAVGPGGVGELWLRGPTVMKGYLGGEEEEKAVDEAGWLRTGDLAYFDEHGFLYIVDRIKELIKHNGYQVAPAELEAILITHPQILDAAVIPIEDEKAGQIPMAYVVRSAESILTGEEVIQFVATQVAPYKKIQKVAFINSIPRSAAGKILRKQLADQNRQAISAKL